MLLKTLKGRHYILLLAVPIFILVLWSKAFVNPVSLTGDHLQMPLYELLKWLTGESLIAINIVGALILCVLALFMVRLNERYVFIRQRTDLPAFVFALLATGSVSLLGMHPALLASILLFFAIDSVFAIYHGSGTLSKSFNAGLFIGLACVSYLFAGLFIFWFWISLAILGYFRSREFLAGFVGFLLPLFIAAIWYFLNDQTAVVLDTIKQLYHHQFVGEFSSFQKIYWGILAILVVLSSLFMVNVSEEKKISSRKYFMILLCFFLLVLFSYFVFSACGTELYYLIIIPVTYIISHYFVLSRYSWMGEVLFAIFILSSLLIHFLG